MINILLVVTGDTGLQYHRQISPHSVMDKLHTQELNITACSNFDLYPNDKLKDIQIVHFIRGISSTGKTEDVVKRCHKYGAKVVLDMDDYWILPSDHGMLNPQMSFDTFCEVNNLKDNPFRFKMFQEKARQVRNIEVVKHKNYVENLFDAFKFVDLVTTTTDRLADEIKPLNKNVEVLPNCIDKTELQWQQNPTLSNKIRIGWLGGVYHQKDLSLLESSIKQTYVDRSTNQVEFVLCGYSPNRDFERYEQIFSDYGKGKAYNRYSVFKGMGINEYGSLYNNFDVAVIPLTEERFCHYKSPLKLVEAGAMGKMAICSSVLPYKDFFSHDEVLYVSPAHNYKGWFKAFKRVQNSRYLIDDYAGKLSEKCDELFDAYYHAERRFQIYQNLIK